ncbi:hypothetical protein WDL1P1_00217 (plasmid) [Variovorax sp. WDL1]|nr:hypothetical protein APY03_2445 [Variovorax sp. WDL1]PNG50178.1 hypothetical protein CHC06_05801 [Variovorax sp. B2]PNG51051.1 hypothetical protein CHC07_05707 [Variovorax sp. B4]VTV17229.1 hypothetical protein WDL1P1_00217 [Variovorax sp. WDL1]
MREGEVSQVELMAKDVEFVIRGLLEEGRAVLVAFSSGKDSSLVLALALNAALALKRSGGDVPPILITHGDTGIENPTISALAMREMEKARQFGLAHGITVVAEVARPSLNDSWAVSVLSGRKLPTFANAASRDCTVGYKVLPMARLRKKLLARFKKHAAAAVTLLGTRFEESTGRAARMEERGESATRPWSKNGQLFLSPIAFWTTDDVWEALGHIRRGALEAFTNARDVFEVYAAGGGSSCAVVADMATEGVKKSRACGARFGCSLCAAVGRDKSLEAMIESDPGYAWLRGLNRIQRFIVDTQYDFDRRSWLQRQSDGNGFLVVKPDTYSPAMLAELLRYCLTADAEERVAARRVGSSPRFQLVSPSAVVAIDASWGLQGQFERPFTAVEIWLDVHVRGRRYHPPENLVAFPPRGVPKERFLWVGTDWGAGENLDFLGLRDVVREMVHQDGTPNTTLKNGRQVLRAHEAELFDVDEEAAEEFLTWEAEHKVEQSTRLDLAGTASYFYYAGLGLISTSKRHLGMLDEVVRRTNWKRDIGLCGSGAAAKAKALSISREKRDEHLSEAARGAKSSVPDRSLHEQGQLKINPS